VFVCVCVHSPKVLLAQPFLGFTKNGVKRGKTKHPVCPVGKNALLMLEVRGEWAD